MAKRVLLFASGRGSNAQALYEAMRDGRADGRTVGLICDHGNAQAVDRARSWGVAVTVIERRGYERLSDFHDAVLDATLSYTPDLICLAGYMRICGENLIHAFPNRILNIHPSLLPSFRGLHAQRQAVEAGVKISGCTVHFVDVGLDDGPIITQAAVPVYDGDTEETLSARILKREHGAYVAAVRAFCADKLKVEGRRVWGMHGEESL